MAVFSERGVVLFETCLVLLLAVSVLCLGHLKVIVAEKQTIENLQETRTTYDGVIRWKATNDFSGYSRLNRSP